jgi:alkylation response protein AidB-like acyl-CoA dehydrogenase
MSTLKLYDRIHYNELSAQDCPLETDFYKVWQNKNLAALTPIEQALEGGALASSLPWVFTAGYQATLQSAFSALPACASSGSARGDSARADCAWPDSGWAAFAATEDTQHPEIHPGTTLTESSGGASLNGCKSWVAHSKVLDTLIITINDAGGDKYKARGVIVDSRADGLSLSHRDNPTFLNKLSQGFAKFDNTPVKISEVFEFGPIRQFGRTEAKFVMLASVAFMLMRVDRDSEPAQRLLNVGTAFEALLAETATSRRAFAAVDLEYQRCVALFEQHTDTSAIADYENDKRLFRMYSDRIQRRANRS